MQNCGCVTHIHKLTYDTTRRALGRRHPSDVSATTSTSRHTTLNFKCLKHTQFASSRQHHRPPSKSCPDWLFPPLAPSQVAHTQIVLTLWLKGPGMSACCPCCTSPAAKGAPIPGLWANTAAAQRFNAHAHASPRWQDAHCLFDHLLPAGSLLPHNPMHNCQQVHAHTPEQATQQALCTNTTQSVGWQNAQLHATRSCSDTLLLLRASWAFLLWRPGHVSCVTAASANSGHVQGFLQQRPVHHTDKLPGGAC